MSQTKRILIALLADFFLFGCAWQGLVKDVEWALNVWLFITWFTAFTNIIFGALLTKGPDKNEIEKIKPRPPVFKEWDIATDLIMIGIAAATGRFALATVSVIGVISKNSGYIALDARIAGAWQSKSQPDKGVTP